MDTYKWSDRFYRAAENIALEEKTGGNLFKFIDELWPAGLRGHTVHYNGKPFDQVELVTAEDVADCIIAPPMKNYKFDATLAFDPNEEEDHHDRDETPKRKRSKKEDRSLSDSEGDGSEMEIPKPFFSQFKRKKY